MVEQTPEITPVDPVLTQPEVPSAYKPNGKLTLMGIVWMLLFSFLGAIIAGIVMYYGGELCVGIGSKFGLIGGLIGMALYFIAIPFWTGMALSFLIISGSMLGKCRNTKATVFISLSASLMFILVYSFFRTQEYKLDAFDSGIDFIKVAIAFFFFSLSSTLASRQLILETPYCDQCDEMMMLVLPPKAAASKSNDLLNAGKAGQFNIFFNEFYQGQGDLNLYLIAKVHYCKKCLVRGFVELFHEQIINEVNNGQTSSRKVTKRIFSAPLSGIDISHLLTLEKTKAAGENKVMTNK